MSEIELAFQIPASKRKALVRAVRRLNPTQIAMQAEYFDTGSFDLFKHHMSLRRRLEHNIWHLTFELPKSSIERIEIDIECTGQNSVPLNLKPYLNKQTLPAELFEELSEKLRPIANSALCRQFKTQVQRQQAVKPLNGSAIEIILDRGQISAVDQAQAIDDIFEIKFALQYGSLKDYMQILLPWVQHYQLWLDSSGRAAKGSMLALGSPALPVQHQTACILKKHENSQSALQKITANCLDHLLPNSSAIALNQYHKEHVHQARVAIRRLRSAFKTFDFDLPMQADLRRQQKQLALIFRQLGSLRDDDALTESLMPQLAAAGSPLLELPQQQPNEPAHAIFQSPAAAHLLLELLEFAYTKQPGRQKLKKQLHHQLQKMHRRICQAQTEFKQMQDTEKHRLRKQVKTLRYSIEFAAGLYPRKAVRRYLKALKPLQENLGRLNDLAVAHSLFAQNCSQQPKSWFVLGWIAAEKKYADRRIHKSLKAFCQIKPL